MLRIENLSVSYGRIQVVHDVTLEVGAGEVVCLIGANGAGKSTIINSICGLIRPQNGRIVFDGDDITHLLTEKTVRRGLIQVPEGRELFPALTVHENLKMGAYALNDKKKVSELEEEVFGLFPILREKLTNMAQTLSGGEQQMLAIGRALMGDPKMLILDEPSFGLAPIIVGRIFEIIQRLNRDRGIPILLVEQNVNMSLRISSRGYVLERGSVVLEGKGLELSEDPHVIECYLGV